MPANLHTENLLQSKHFCSEPQGTLLSLDDWESSEVTGATALQDCRLRNMVKQAVVSVSSRLEISRHATLVRRNSQDLPSFLQRRLPAGAPDCPGDGKSMPSRVTRQWLFGKLKQAKGSLRDLGVSMRRCWNCESRFLQTIPQSFACGKLLQVESSSATSQDFELTPETCRRDCTAFGFSLKATDIF